MKVNVFAKRLEKLIKRIYHIEFLHKSRFMYLVFRIETRFNFVRKFKFHFLTNSLKMI